MDYYNPNTRGNHLKIGQKNKQKQVWKKIFFLFITLVSQINQSRVAYPSCYQRLSFLSQLSCSHGFEFFSVSISCHNIIPLTFISLFNLLVDNYNFQHIAHKKKWTKQLIHSPYKQNIETTISIVTNFKRYNQIQIKLKSRKQQKSAVWNTYFQLNWTTKLLSFQFLCKFSINSKKSILSTL